METRKWRSLLSNFCTREAEREQKGQCASEVSEAGTSRTSSTSLTRASGVAIWFYLETSHISLSKSNQVWLIDYKAPSCLKPHFCLV